MALVRNCVCKTLELNHGIVRNCVCKTLELNHGISKKLCL